MGVSYNTISGLRLFADEIKNASLLHIPHSSTHIPDYTGFVIEELEENLFYLTDWATDSIFDIDGIEKIITPFSRLFCDVERYEDENEPMFRIGRGYYYTNGYNGNPLRHFNLELKNQIYNDFYLQHHQMLCEKVKMRLDKFGVCHIVDCHSFDESMLGNHHNNYPDICIGFSEFHTPKYILDKAQIYFSNQGYSVDINNPYSGSIVPKEHLLKEINVTSIMIEINKRLYMNGKNINKTEVDKLQRVINGFFDF